jgi:hypothetical protein
MRRPVSVKWFVHFIVEQDFLFAESPTVATLPSALFNERLSLGASCSRFSRCCHLFIDLPFHS